MWQYPMSSRLAAQGILAWYPCLACVDEGAAAAGLAKPDWLSLQTLLQELGEGWNIWLSGG
jgi:hypothetical protein